MVPRQGKGPEEKKRNPFLFLFICKPAAGYRNEDRVHDGCYIRPFKSPEEIFQKII